MFVLPSAFAQSAPVTKPSGLVFQSLVDGKGASAAATDVVKVHYRGTFPDGKEFDSSYKRGEPTEFPLNGVIPCWTEGVQLMKVGGKAKLTCPPGVVNPDPTISVPRSRSGPSDMPRSNNPCGSSVGMDICTTGTSASGYISFSGT